MSLLGDCGCGGVTTFFASPALVLDGALALQPAHYAGGPTMTGPERALTQDHADPAVFLLAVAQAFCGFAA